jgi:hypothetical protein
MTYQKAILVPRHGLRETIRAVRYTRETTPPNSSLSPSGTPALPSTIEIWLGDFYGEPREMITSHSASDRAEFVFSANESPVVAPDRSLVVVIRDPPSQWIVVSDCESRDDGGSTVSRHVAMDCFGTMREVSTGETVSRPAIETPAG